METQRSKLKEISSKLSMIINFTCSPHADITKMEDWYHVQRDSFRLVDGGTILFLRYKSRYKLLRSVFPEYHITDFMLSDLISLGCVQVSTRLE